MQGQQHIHCSVSNCHYYKQGNFCDANEILITSDQVGATKPDQFDCSQASTMGPTPVDTCMESCCKTFVHKNSQSINVDGVKRL